MTVRHHLAVCFALTLVACGSDNNNDTTPTDSGDFPAEVGTYSFESRFIPGEDSVAYSGQIARQVLIEDLKTFVDDLTLAIDDASFTVGGEGSVVAALDFYFRFDSDAYGDEEHEFATELAPAQSTYASISSGKDLVGKLAGNDNATDHKDWSTDFGGWSDPSIAEHGGGIDSPENFVVALFETVEANAIARAEGVDRLAPDGSPLPVHITEDGRDLAQLIEKFLHGAVSFSQGADDYLDDDTDGKGLLASIDQDEDNPYSAVEHAWDEGFGYFGAARRYLDMTDEEIAEVGHADFDGDGAIDLTSEVAFGASANAAKRDLGSQTGTDLTTETFTAFWNGRRLLAEADGELDDKQLDELREYRDAAVLGWEKALAATVVHYINDTIEQTEGLDTDGYSFEDHAKVWSEMKGFAMAFQFNPRSPLSDDEFATVHELMRDAPELAEDGGEAYITDLEEARDILSAAYEFERADVEAW